MRLGRSREPGTELDCSRAGALSSGRDDALQALDQPSGRRPSALAVAGDPVDTGDFLTTSVVGLRCCQEIKERIESLPFLACISDRGR